MKTIELKRLAPYLPYELRCQVTEKDAKGSDPEIAVLKAIYTNNTYVFYDLVESHKGFRSVKPILHPLSDLENMFESDTFEIKEFAEYVGGDWCDIYDDAIIHIAENIHTGINILALPYHLTEWLILLHFDVFGLIKEGLAIDINTL